MEASYNTKVAGKKLKTWQKESRLLGKDIAKRAGVSPAYYSNIQNGKQRGSITTLTRICNVLGHDVGDLLDDSKASLEPKIDKRKLKRTLKPIVGNEALDDAIECVEIWLRAPTSLKRALRAFAVAS